MEKAAGRLVNNLSPLREKTSPAGVAHFVRTPAPSPDGEGRGEVLINIHFTHLTHSTHLTHIQKIPPLHRERIEIWFET